MEGKVSLLLILVEVHQVIVLLKETVNAVVNITIQQLTTEAAQVEASLGMIA